MSENAKVQDNLMKANEKKKKKFKVLQDYGYVLKDVEALADLISTDFTDLSMESVSKELESLIKSRNTTTNQITFTFYQDLFTHITDELLELEESYQKGELSSSQAHEKVASLSNQLESNASEIPETMNSSRDDLRHLINMYKEGFSAEKQENVSSLAENYNLSDDSKIRFENLNIKTKELSTKVTNLSTALSKFEPNAQLNGLYDQLKSTDEFFKNENWTADDASVKVADLKLTTETLTREQTLKNKDHASYATQITSLSTEIKETSKTSVKEISQKIFEQASARANKTVEKIDKVEELAEGNMSMPENTATQYAYAMESLTIADAENATDLASNENVDAELFNSQENEMTLDDLAMMRANINELSKTRAPQYNPEEDDDNK